jgi:DNA-binding transcriptional ArsR family regulator
MFSPAKVQRECATADRLHAVGPRTGSALKVPRLGSRLANGLRPRSAMARHSAQLDARFAQVPSPLAARCPHGGCATKLLRNCSVVHIVSVMATTTSEDELGAAFAALGDSTRRAIVRRLSHSDATVSELAEPFGVTHQAISRHVGVLRRCGLIEQRVDGQRRPCSLNVDRMRELEDWITEQRRQWSSRLDKLDEHLSSLQGDGR